jgi:hypothetical protein
MSNTNHQSQKSVKRARKFDVSFTIRYKQTGSRIRPTLVIFDSSRKSGHIRQAQDLRNSPCEELVRMGLAEMRRARRTGGKVDTYTHKEDPRSGECRSLHFVVFYTHSAVGKRPVFFMLDDTTAHRTAEAVWRGGRAARNETCREVLRLAYDDLRQYVRRD